MVIHYFNVVARVAFVLLTTRSEREKHKRFGVSGSPLSVFFRRLSGNETIKSDPETRKNGLGERLNGV